MDLVRESKIDSKRRKDEALEGLLCSKVVRVLGDDSHIRLIKLDQVVVFLNARWCHGLGEDRGTARHWVKMFSLGL